MGAPSADNNGRYASGTAYVVPGGSTDPLDLLALGPRGVSIDGAAEFDYAGRSVAGVGDVNGDGGPDVVIGASGANSNGRTDSGAAYVIFGTPPPQTLPTPTAPPTAPPAITPAAALTVKAPKKTKEVRRKGRTKLVRSITVGPGQKARVKVTLRPRKARKTVKVKKSVRRVVVLTKGTRKKTRIRVRIISRGPGYTPTTWVRTWRVR